MQFKFYDLPLNVYLSNPSPYIVLLLYHSITFISTDIFLIRKCFLLLLLDKTQGIKYISGGD